MCWGDERSATNLARGRTSWASIFLVGLVELAGGLGCGPVNEAGADRSPVIAPSATGGGGAAATGGIGGTAGTSTAIPRPTTPACGNGILEEGESCDDGNAVPADGCGATCLVEAGWHCATPTASTTASAALVSASASASMCTPTHPSCAGAVPLVCRGQDPDCCGSGLVPGGTFQRDADIDPLYAATVSDFRLDTYEVTVGRFAAFVASYPASKPAPYTGRNPNDYIDPGWNAAWDANLPVDQVALTAAVQCDAAEETWGKGDDLAMNCVTWYEATAFCIWDGGRLPTSAEWNYAAAGGTEGRIYPWSVPPSDDHIDPSHAIYDAPPGGVRFVGSTSPQGDGKFGQSDLAGNVWEWVQDWYAPYDSVCHDCANLVPSIDRATRGGSWYDDATYQLASSLDAYDPSYRVNYIGFRCVRSAAAGAVSVAPQAVK